MGVTCDAFKKLWKTENTCDENLLFKKFTMRSGIVFRKFFSKRNDKDLFTVYVPTSILRDVIMHSHLSESHSSGRQTFKSFSEFFYHPQAQKIARQLCRTCEQCEKERESFDTVKKVPKNRALRPAKPREGLSLDIVCLPKTKNGYSYGLIVYDLFTLYVSFYPMDNNDSRSVAQCLAKYFALHGVPKSIYTEDCRSFRSSVDSLLFSHNITHVTFDEYKKRLSNAESQVLTLKKAFRTTICQSRFFQDPKWNETFPILMCKLNAAIAKYGINRESLYHGEIVESSLRLLSDIDILGPLEDEFDQVCKRFRDKMGRFMGKKSRVKSAEERKRNEQRINMHEIVMRGVFLRKGSERSDMTYTGPYRVIGLCAQGVTLRDLKDGSMFSVAFEFVRKLKWDELFTLLPQNSRAGIMKVIGLLGEETVGRQKESKEKEENSSNGKYLPHRKPGTLRPGKLYTVKIESVPAELRNTVRKAYWRKEKIGRKTKSKASLPSLVKTYDEDTLWLGGFDNQYWDNERGIYRMYDRNGRNCYSFSEREVYEGKGKKNYKGRLACSFQSEHTGTLRLLLKREVDRGKERQGIRFSDLTVYFY
jgi:hypothetical protein